MQGRTRPLSVGVSWNGRRNWGQDSGEGEGASFVMTPTQPPEQHQKETSPQRLDNTICIVADNKSEKRRHSRSSFKPTFCASRFALTPLVPTQITQSFRMGKKRVLVSYGVDVDAVAGWLGSYGGEDSTSDISRGIFAGTIGTQRLLKLFKKVPAIYGIAKGWELIRHSTT